MFLFVRINQNYFQAKMSGGYHEKHIVKEDATGRHEEHHVSTGDDRDLGDKIKDGAKNAWEATKEKAHDVKEKAKETFGSDKHPTTGTHVVHEEHHEEVRRI